MDQRRPFGVEDEMHGTSRETEAENKIGVGSKDKQCREGNQVTSPSVKQFKPNEGERRDELRPSFGILDGYHHVNVGGRCVVEEDQQYSGEPQKEGKKKAGSIDLIRILMEQNYCCAVCGSELTPKGSEVDHKRSKADGGDDSPDNLQWLCKLCNRAKGDMSMEAFMAMLERIARQWHKAPMRDT